MKKLFLFIGLLTLSSLITNAQLLKKLGDKIKNRTEQRADQRTDQAIDKGLDKTEDATKKKNGNTNTNSNSNNRETKDISSGETQSAPQSLKVYANYDFVPGDKIMFEDNFTDDQDGEFPSHWELGNGQAVLNKLNETEAFDLTDGNYCIVTPLTKTKSYLTDPFTIEYDIYNPENGAYGLMCFFYNSEGKIGYVQTTAAEATCEFADGKSLNGSYPKELAYDNFKDKWHHVAIAYKNKQIKIYLDQFRVLVVPNSGLLPEYVNFGGIGDNTHPIIFKNVRIAAGGNMNMLGKKFTETKIVTHGINFDIDKSTIKPESMGTLNMIIQVLKDNPDIKFEIDGHTDNTGTAAHNLTLSQQRADAVKDQLVKMGIDESRLIPKGLGDTKPISDNTSLEGKANNRRVEFVKM